MKVNTTAEKGPAYLFISGIRSMLAGGTYKYHDCIEVVAVFLVKFPVVLVCHFPELFVEARLRVQPLLYESRFDWGGQVIAQSIWIA